MHQLLSQLSIYYILLLLQICVTSENDEKFIYLMYAVSQHVV